MNTLKWILIAISGALSGCAALPPERLPLKLNEVQSLGKQKLATDALIEQIEQRGVDFSLTPENSSQLKSAGVREPVMRYLQGRDAGLRAANSALGYRDPFCSSGFYRPFYLDPFPVRYIHVHQLPP